MITNTVGAATMSRVSVSVGSERISQRITDSSETQVPTQKGPL